MFIKQNVLLVVVALEVGGVAGVDGGVGAGRGLVPTVGTVSSTVTLPAVRNAAT